MHTLPSQAPLSNEFPPIIMQGQTDEQARHTMPHAVAQTHSELLENMNSMMRKEPLPHLPPDEPEPRVAFIPQVSLAGENMADSETVGTPDKNPDRNGNVLGKLSILAEADAIAGENRSRDYGHPLANHRRIADIWNVQLEKKLAVPLTPGDVALLMVGLKLARLINSPNHRDSLVDAAGYIKCYDMIQEAGGE